MFTKFCYHLLPMPLQHCANCGKEFQRSFGDTSLSQSCPECEARKAQADETPLLPVVEASSAASFAVTTALIAANALVFVVMVLRGVSPIDPTPAQAVAFGADFGPLTLSGQWWRLVSS